MPRSGQGERGTIGLKCSIDIVNAFWKSKLKYRSNNENMHNHARGRGSYSAIAQAIFKIHNISKMTVRIIRCSSISAKSLCQQSSLSGCYIKETSCDFVASLISSTIGVSSVLGHQHVFIR